MLAPDTRQTLLDALRPPVGRRLGYAVGTTYSLSLDAALTAPAAFALHAAAEASDDRQVEPLELLESLRRHAGRFTVFFQAGQVSVPTQRRLFAYLEGALLPVVAPKGGVFHPKVWVLRFEGDGEQPCFRVLCASRNLTYDRSWDTILRLDSVTDPDADEAVIEPAGLAAFVRRLPDLAVGAVEATRTAAIAALAEQLEGVRWQAPDGVTSGGFVPLGLTGDTPPVPFPTNSDRVAIISPFLADGLLAKLPTSSRRSVLVSRPEEINRCANAVDQRFGEVFTMDPDGLQPAEDASTPNAPPDDPNIPFEGLHAKLYVFDHGSTSTVFTGSANATNAAFAANVELLTRMEGPRAALGVDVLMEEPKKEVQTLRTFLIPFTLDLGTDRSSETVAEDPLDRVRRELAAVSLLATARERGSQDRFSLRFEWDGVLPAMPAGTKWRCWPASLPRDAGHALDPTGITEVEFSVSFEGITAFLANELTLGDETTAFVLTADLQEAPADRSNRLLRILLGDAERFLRYLLMLLADDAVDAWGLSDLLDAMEGTTDRKWRTAGDSIPLLEALLRTLSSDPDRLDHINQLIVDLCADEEGRELLPPGLLDIWDPVWAVAKEPRQ